MDVKVLGPGCANCKKTEEIVRSALAEAGLEADFEHVTKPMDIAKFGVFTTPAVVIDGQVKAVGKVPTKEEVRDWLAQG